MADKPWWKNWKIILGIVVAVAAVGALTDTEEEPVSDILEEETQETAQPDEPDEPEESEPSPAEAASACERAFARAAAVDEMQDTIDDMLPAVRACESVDEWNAASAAHPDALDGADPETVLANMCASRNDINDAPLCETRRGPGLTPRKLAKQACEDLKAGKREPKVVQELAAKTTEEDIDLVETLTEIERQCPELLS